jgi:chromosome segregation ATPase
LNELAGLRSELAEQSQKLESSNASLENYRLRVNELLSIISELETRLKQLSESFENVVRPLQQALTVAERELRRQKIKTVIWVILAAAAAGAAGYGIKAVVDGR